MKKELLIGIGILMMLVLNGCNSEDYPSCEDVAKNDYGFANPSCKTGIGINTKFCECMEIINKTNSYRFDYFSKVSFNVVKNDSHR